MLQLSESIVTTALIRVAGRNFKAEHGPFSQFTGNRDFSIHALHHMLHDRES